MKNFNKDKELLSAYLDGELSQTEKKYIEEKIKSSLELQKELADLKKLKDLTTTSFERISDSPYFETRVMAALNHNSNKKYTFKKWIPAISLSVVTIGLMVLLKFNPNFINNLIEEQKSNIAGFYKENLQPLLYAANLTNEDIFNFAMNQQLPLDNENKQVLQFGYDPQGKEYFEIKKLDNINTAKSENNFQKFVTALNLDPDETEQIDSIIGSYSEQLSSLVLVNEKNSVAINPVIWNTRKAILADIISYAQSHASENFYKIIPKDVAEINVNSVKKWVNESKNVKDDQYIFCTPDSIFKEDFVFNVTEFKKNMKQMEKEFKEFDKQTKEFSKLTFFMDTTSGKVKKTSKQTQQFKVFTDSGIVKVTIQNFNVPDINIEDFKMPDFDSIAMVIVNEATKNLETVTTTLPQIPFVNKNFKIEVNAGKSKKSNKIEINLDSLMNLRNTLTDSLHLEQLKRLENLDDSLNKNFNYYPTDSLIILQNNELKKEMDNLRKELQKFREEMKNYDNKSDEKNQNNYKETRSGEIKLFQL